MSQADDDFNTNDAATNVLPFPTRSRELPAAAHEPPPSDEEITVAVIEEHLGTLELAALTMVHSLQRQRTLLEELKAQLGMKFSIPPRLIGDSGLVQDYELRIVPKAQKRKR